MLKTVFGATLLVVCAAALVNGHAWMVSPVPASGNAVVRTNSLRLLSYSLCDPHQVVAWARAMPLLMPPAAESPAQL